MSPSEINKLAALSTPALLDELNLTGTYWGQRILEVVELQGIAQNGERDSELQYLDAARYSWAACYLQTKSSSWTPCACGHADPRIPRDQYGVPKDEKLKSLGLAFTSSIANRNWRDASFILGQIENRVTKLLIEQGSTIHEEGEQL